MAALARAAERKAGAKPRQAAPEPRQAEGKSAVRPAPEPEKPKQSAPSDTAGALLKARQEKKKL